MKLKQILRALDRKGFTSVDGYRVRRELWNEGISVDLFGIYEDVSYTPSLSEYFEDDWQLIKTKVFKNGKVKYSLIEDLETL